jgi:hypothetical protein
MDGCRSNSDEAQSDAVFPIIAKLPSAEFQMHHQVIKLKQAFLSVTSVVELKGAKRSQKEPKRAKRSQKESKSSAWSSKEPHKPARSSKEPQ